MSKQKPTTIKMKKAVKGAVDRQGIEAALGRKMHEIGKEQAIFSASQQRLQKLQAEANEINAKLDKHDG